MKPDEVTQLELAAPVWVWIVRFDRGRWWPGTAERVQITKGMPLVVVRFEPFRLGRHRSDPPITVGFITAPMRRLERRDPCANGADRPRFVPVSRLRSPEMPACVDNLDLVEAGPRTSSHGSVTNGSRSSPIEEGSHGNKTVPALLDKS